MRFTHSTELLPEYVLDIFNASTIHSYEPGPSHFTATGLERGPMEVALLKEHGRQDTEILDGLRAFRGTIAHKILEDGAQSLSNVDTERRLYREIEVDNRRFVLSAQYDALVRQGEKNILVDWKGAAVGSLTYGTQPDKGGMETEFGPRKRSWVMQANINRMLIEGDSSYYLRWLDKDWRDHVGDDYISSPYLKSRKAEWAATKVDEIHFVALVFDWRASETYDDEGYPFGWITVKRMPILTDEEVMSYVQERVRRQLPAMDGEEPDMCSAEESWTTKGVFKVYDKESLSKPKARAINGGANFETLREASAFAREQEKKWQASKKKSDRERKTAIKKTADKHAKCARWCDVAKFCKRASVIEKNPWEIHAERERRNS